MGDHVSKVGVVLELLLVILGWVGEELSVGVLGVR